MSIFNNIDSVWREVWSSPVNINGVWRDSDALVNINGVWRQSHKKEISEEDIIGFRIVYKRNPNKIHHLLNHLTFNPNIPASMLLTGDNAGFMDLSPKGVLFQYDNSNPEEEGIIMYEGKLYAVLNNDIVIDVCKTKEYWGDDDRLPSNAPDITEVWATNKINDLSISIQAQLSYESNGFYIAGWNSLFNTTQFIDTNSSIEDKNKYEMNSYNILPIENRESTFDYIASIGIARDMHTANTNMVGSYGNLDHTIHWITVNGVNKPFVFEIYD